MKFLFASDSFKGTLSSVQIAELLARAAKQVFPDCECLGIPVADGGEGTMEAVLRATNGTMVPVAVHGPLMRQVKASFGKISDKKAILEMAAASGLFLLQEEERNPLKTTSYGTGELIAAALKAGCREITVAIGGSATNDGGMGCMSALGVRFLDASGTELSPIGENLAKVAEIDVSNLLPEALEADFTVICDVTNPLCGTQGATYTYGAQKGGTPEILKELEAGMCNYRNVIQKKLGMDPDDIPGAGAAGGLGCALAVLLKAKLKSGIETVLDLMEFDSQLQGVSLVVTGEGTLDLQSCYGKVVQGVGVRCKRAGIPAVALVGSMGEGAEQIYEYGISSVMTTVNAVKPLTEFLEQAEQLYYDAAVRMFSMINTGRKL